MTRTVVLAVSLVIVAILVAARAQEEHDPGRGESAISVCDSITCEMECRKKTKDCGAYGCNGVCIGYACQCFTKPRAPAGGWKEYNPLAEGYESLYGVLYDTGGGTQPAATPPPPPPPPPAFQQLQQQFFQPLPTPTQPPMVLVQQQQQQQQQLFLQLQLQMRQRAQEQLQQQAQHQQQLAQQLQQEQQQAQQADLQQLQLYEQQR